MTANAAQSNALFDSMHDDLLLDITHAYGTPTSKEHLASEILKLMVHSLRMGAPSQRMMNLLAKRMGNPSRRAIARISATEAPIKPEQLQKLMDTLATRVAKIKPERALSVLVGTKTGLSFRTQEAIDAFEFHATEGDTVEEAEIAAYNAYFAAQQRIYATDLVREIKCNGEPWTVAEQTMETVVRKLLRRAGALQVKPPGRKKSTTKNTL